MHTHCRRLVIMASRPSRLAADRFCFKSMPVLIGICHSSPFCSIGATPLTSSATCEFNCVKPWAVASDAIEAFHSSYHSNMRSAIANINDTSSSCAQQRLLCAHLVLVLCVLCITCAQHTVCSWCYDLQSQIVLLQPVVPLIRIVRLGCGRHGCHRTKLKSTI